MIEIFRRLFGGVATLGKPRSPGWRALRERHLAANPCCIACGSTKNVVPHHVVPFHVNPSRELDPDNLVTLCESPTFNCHLFFGHFKRWDRHNPSVAEDARVWRAKMEGGPS